MRSPHAEYAVDAQLALGTATGIGVYIRGLLSAFEAANFGVVALQAAWLDPWRFDRRVIWDQLVLPWQARHARVLHCTAGTMPLTYQGPIVVTVHDVAWLRVQQHTRAYARAYFGALMVKRYQNADRIIVVSEFARQELLHFAAVEPERISVIYNGVDAAFANILRCPDYHAPRMLVVGTIEVRKNLAIVLEAMAKMRNRSVRLIVPGPATPYRAYCQTRARELGLAARVDFLGYISQAELLAQYARASIALVPSLYEGFGYAAAQALVAGVPCISSTSASLPEIVGDAAPCLAADDPEAWAQACDTMLEDYEGVARAARAGRPSAQQRFGWANAAARTQTVYEAAQAEAVFGGRATERRR